MQKTEEYKFEGISRFTYVGTLLTENNSIIAEINERIKKRKCNVLQKSKIVNLKIAYQKY